MRITAASPGIAESSRPDTPSVRATAIVRNTSVAAWKGQGVAHIAEVGASHPVAARLAPGERKGVALPAIQVANAKLWHFDHPHLDHPDLYELTAVVSNHDRSTTMFGIRKLEIRD